MRTRLEGDAHAPAAARLFVTNALVEIGSAQGLRDDLALIVSELVTNSVRASARVVYVELRIAADRVEVQVTDDASGWPVSQDVQDDSVAGRGLKIVDQLADSWRAVRRGAGKSVIATRLRTAD